MFHLLLAVNLKGIHSGSFVLCQVWNPNSGVFASLLADFGFTFDIFLKKIQNAILSYNFKNE